MRKLIWMAVVVGVSTATVTVLASRTVQPEREGKGLAEAAAVEYTPQAEAEMSDPLAGVSQRLGRALISCREQRRDELCRHSNQECAQLRRKRNRLDLTGEETRYCQFDCVTGVIYQQATDSLLSYLRTFKDRPGQIDVLRKELLTCAQGSALKIFQQHAPELQPIALPWLDLDIKE